MNKIAFYIDSMQMGGANRVMANLSNHFSKDYDVMLINDILPEKGKNEYEIKKCVKRFFVDQEVGNVGNSKIKKNILRIYTLRKVIKREKPDVVVSFMGPPNYRMLLATVGLHTRKIVSVRNDPYREYGYGVHKFATKMLFRMADGVVFQTGQAMNYFPKSVQRKSKIIFNPVNEVFYEPSILKKEKRIVVVGRLEPQKNPGLAIEAFSKLKDKYFDFNLVFVGDGSLKDSLQEKVRKLGLLDRVQFLGQISDVKEIMATSSLYLLTSDYEGMPNALMEAMASGLAVISTDCPCGGPRSIILSDEQGILIEVGSSDQLITAMDYLLSDPVQMSNIGKSAQKRAEQFKPSIIYQQWKEFILS